jgi:hypothetical protein
MLDSGLVAYVKCVLVGLITGIGTILIRAVAELVVPITRMMLKRRQRIHCRRRVAFRGVLRVSRRFDPTLDSGLRDRIRPHAAATAAAGADPMSVSLCSPI